jgi:hypothetical protein
MFISNEEKTNIQNAIESLRFGLASATTDILTLKAKINQLERDAVKPVKVKKPKKVLTAAQKAKQREYQRLYKARKKQEEQNWTLVQQIAAEGTPNVSA